MYMSIASFSIVGADLEGVLSSEIETSAVTGNHEALGAITIVAIEGEEGLSSNLEGQDDSGDEREGEMHC
jgi:hypothetical protein